MTMPNGSTQKNTRRNQKRRNLNGTNPVTIANTPKKKTDGDGDPVTTT